MSKGDPTSFSPSPYLGDGTYKSVGISSFANRPIPRPQEAQVISLALLGNPGAGKSTILNGLIGSAYFRAGIHIGGGLTTVLQSYEKDAVTFYDTPGMADIERAQQAGQEIDKLLHTKKDIKFAFVVTLEEGRARPADAATIDAILSAITNIDVNNKFGVILNKLEPEVFDALEENANDVAVKLRASLTGKFSTSHWLYVPKYSEVAGKNDQMLRTDDITIFLHGLPQTKPADAVVTKVKAPSREEHQEFKEAIDKIMSAHREELRLMNQRFQTERREQYQRIDALERRLNVNTEKSGKMKRIGGGAGAAAGAGLTLLGVATLNPFIVLAGLGVAGAGMGMSMGKHK